LEEELDHCEHLLTQDSIKEKYIPATNSASSGPKSVKKD